jgi:BlaI family transcriptional regulator, penicillinase repressor
MTDQRPTEAELEILAILWKNGPSTVRAVNEELNSRKNVGYTTTLKFMQIMTEKGIVERSLEGRMHIYSPLLKEEEVQSSLVNRLLETAFRGSAKNLILQALGNHRASEEELTEIKAMIQKMEEDSL